MAKDKRGLDDLDAELAALEAELAALEGRKAAPPAKAKKEKRAAAPADASAQEAQPDAAAPEAPAKKGRFSLPLKRKAKAEEEPPADAPAAAPAPSKEREPLLTKPKIALKLPGLKKTADAGAQEGPQRTSVTEGSSTVEQVARAPAFARTYDPSVWREEGGAWVRTLSREPAVVRRILDENGEVVREEPASKADLDEVSGVKAERGIGALFRRRGK